MGEVRCKVIAWTMDQPENCGCNQLLLGGTSFARFGYELDIAQIQDKIRPCRICFSAMASVQGNDLWSDRQCNLCNNWMIHRVME